MIIIDAKWEERNLGIKVQEVQIERKDSLQDISQMILKLDSKYQVIKVPVKRVDVHFLLANRGFVFIEAMNKLYFDIEKSNVEDKYKSQNLNLSLMNQDEINNMIKQIEKNLFNTDRVSLDINFSKEIAAKRYIGWVKDEQEKKSWFIKCMLNEKQIGFLAIKKMSNKEYDNFLYGVYPEFRNQGYAIKMTYKLIEKLKEIGGEKLYTNISSNNESSLFSRARHGFIISDITYVFVKHI